MSFLSKTKTATKAATRYLTPWPSVKRSADSVRGCISRTADKVRAVRDAMARHKASVDQARKEEADFLKTLPRGTTAEQRFHAYYSNWDWSEEGLAEHRIVHRRLKRIMFISGGVCLVLAILNGLSGNPVLQLFTMPVLLLGAFALPARGLVDAKQQARIELRSMIGMRQFVSRPDFFKRLWA